MQSRDNVMSNVNKILIPDLKLKLRHLLEDDDAKLIGRHNGSANDFAKAVDIPLRTFTGYLKDQEQGGNKRSQIETRYSTKIATQFKFESDWQPWTRGDIDAFKDAFEERAKPLLNVASHSKSAVVWPPSSTKSQVLARLKALRLEELAGAKIGSGYIPLAEHSVTFSRPPPAPQCEPSDNGLIPVPGDLVTRLKLGESQFASIFLSGLTRNDLSFPWPLGLDFDLGELDDGLHIVECSVEFELTGSATTCAVGDRKRYRGDLEVTPMTEVKRCKVQIMPHGTNPKKPGWTVKLQKGPIGSFTAKSLLEISEAKAGDVVRVILILPLKGLADSIDTIA